MRKMVLGVLVLSVLSFNVVSGMGGALVPAQSREGMETLLDVRIGRSDFEDIIRNAITDVLGDRLCSGGGTEIDAAIRVAARSIEREHINQMHILALQARTILQRAESERIQAEKAATLRGLLLRINVDDKTLITKRAADMERLDVVERHKEVESLYKRFLPYEELFGRADLGVVATTGDLEAVRHYVDETTVTPLTAVKPSERPRLIGVDHGWGNRGGDVEWNNGRRGGPDHGAWVNPTLVSWLHGLGESNFTTWWWNKYAPFWPGEQLSAAIGRAMSTYNGLLATYEAQKAQYESQMEHATAVVFPSESFNILIDQVNRFFVEGLQDVQ